MTRPEREAAAIRQKLMERDFYRELRRITERRRSPDGGLLTPHLLTENKR